MEIRKNARRVSTLGAVAIAMVLAMASTAVACTTFKGKMTVTATGAAASGSASADGDPNSGDSGPSGTGHGYCGTPQRGVLQTLGTFTLTIGATTECATSNSLNANTYDVYWVNAAPVEGAGSPPNSGNAQVDFWADSLTDPQTYQCFTNAVQSTAKQHLGTITVSSGTGIGYFDLAGKAVPGPGNICAYLSSVADVGASTSAPMVFITWI